MFVPSAAWANYGLMHSATASSEKSSATEEFTPPMLRT